MKVLRHIKKLVMDHRQTNRWPEPTNDDLDHVYQRQVRYISFFNTGWLARYSRVSVPAWYHLANVTVNLNTGFSLGVNRRIWSVDLESGKVTVSTPPIECRPFDILLPHLLLPVMDSAVEEKQQVFSTLRLVCRRPNWRQPTRLLPLSIGTESGFCSHKLLLTPHRCACVVTICSDSLGWHARHPGTPG